MMGAPGSAHWVVRMNYRNRSLSGLLLFATLALSAITVGMMGWTAKLGGVIRHTEIRAAGAQAATPAAPETKKDDDDDH